MNFDLTEEQQLVAASARDFAVRHLDPFAVELDRNGRFPSEIIGHLAAQGFMGLLLPPEYGGAGAGFVSHVVVIEAIAQSCAAVALILNAHMLAAETIRRWGSDDEKQHDLPAMASGAQLGALAIQEAGPTIGFGADAVIASRGGGGFLLNGVKTFVRNAGAASLYVVFASVQTAAGMRSPGAFVVHGDAPGLSVGPSLDTMGLKGCPVAHLTFNNVRLPEDALLRNGRQASIDLLTALGWVAEAAQTAGIAAAALRHAATYAGQRIQFGKPIGSFQGVQVLLAEIAAHRHLAWLGTLRAAQTIEDGRPFETDAAMIRTFLANFASRMTIDCCQVEGGAGYSEAMPLSRLFRDMAGTILLDPPGDFPEGQVLEAIGT